MICHLLPLMKAVYFVVENFNRKICCDFSIMFADKHCSNFGTNELNLSSNYTRIGKKTE